MMSVQQAQAQANKRLLLLGADIYRGVGSYSAITFGAGLNAAYHKPLQNNLVLVGKAGLNYYKAEFYSVGTGFGYTGNPTTTYPGQFYSTYNETSVSGLTLPVTIGLRQYLPSIAKGAHADAGIGAEVGIYNASTSFLFAPSVGYMLPLKAGNYLDLNLSILTSFARGGTIVGIGAALGLPQ